MRLVWLVQFTRFTRKNGVIRYLEQIKEDVIVIQLNKIVKNVNV